jgi:mRNA interferase HigB
MVIISKGIIRHFIEKHPNDNEAFENWYDKVKAADWKNFSELKCTFNSVDSVGSDRYVFNIKGNQYRLVALIIFKVRTVFILFIGTHPEYDLIDVKSVAYKK